ncbi:MAG: hypothetical protein IJP95_05955 [Bacteroidales bacterium]|nr:hypothetical protein [Bacteroidales bacterium]
MATELIDCRRLEEVGGERDAQAICRAVRRDNAFADFARGFAFCHQPKVARNALWCLTKATDDELRGLQPLMDNFIDQAIGTEYSAVRRLSLSIVERLAIPKDNLRTDFLDFCLRHMASLDEPPGVQTLCMKLAFRMCGFYPELRHEFFHSLQAMDPDYYKPAVKCVRNRILSGKLQA